MVAFVVIGVTAVFVIYRAASSALTKTKTATETTINNSSQTFLLQLGGAYFVIDAVANLPSGLIFQRVAGLL